MVSPIPKFSSTVVNGKLVIREQEKFNRYINTLHGELETIVRKERHSRSTSQNKYYWGVVVFLLSDEIGYAEEETHEIIKSLFLREERLLKGQPVNISKSTSSLSSIEFEAFMSKVREWASKEFGIYIPLPNEVNLED